MFRKKMNRIERREFQKQKLAQNLAGSGLYVYENNTSGTLTLPKPTNSGKRVVAPKEQFQGDSYFLSLVKPPNNLLKLVKTITTDLPAETQPQTLMESNMNEQKLILDQPDRVTSKGTIEQVVKQQPVQKLNDSVEKKQPSKEVLLTEDPLDGVEIILG